MPNIESAKKRMRQAEKARQRNVEVKSQVKHMRRSFFETIDATNKEACDKAFRSYCSTLDKAAKCGTIKKNTAMRRKNRAANQLRALLAKAGQTAEVAPATAD